MTGIVSVELQEYKCFEQLKLPFAPLTLLSGYNGAGKSTSIQPLLLLAQAAKRGLWGRGNPIESVPLNGDIVRLGTIGDVIRSSHSRSEMRFSISNGVDEISLEAVGKAGARSLEIKLSDSSGKINWLTEKLSNLVYLGAVRGRAIAYGLFSV